MRILALAIVVLGMSSCATMSPTPEAATYQNPVLDSDFPDPAMLRTADGWYYAYATQGRVDGTMLNIQTARSRDLVRWERTGDALPVKPAWASRTQDFWAPHVHAADGRYFLYYSGKPDVALADTSQGLCLAVATADRPEGPFTDIGAPLQCGEGFVNIDPMAYDDPATGKRLLYWGSGFQPIKVQELAPDRISFAPGSRPVDLVAVDRTDDPANYQRLIEGAWVIRREGYYYLFYSGDNCCGSNAHYALMVARSRSAIGPFETLEQASGTRSSVILAMDERWLGPGHNGLIKDSAGTWWTLYHAVDRRRPRTLPTDDVNSRRIMLLDRLEWHDGWPRLAGGRPTSSPTEAPRIR